jgi:hypothetical protein
MQRAAATDSPSQRVAIDLSFDAIMNDKEIRSLAKQLKLSYGVIKQMDDPFQLVLCNASEALCTSLERFSADRWAVQWRQDASDLRELFQPSVRGMKGVSDREEGQELTLYRHWMPGGGISRSWSTCRRTHRPR